MPSDGNVRNQKTRSGGSYLALEFEQAGTRRKRRVLSLAKGRGGASALRRQRWAGGVHRLRICLQIQPVRGTLPDGVPLRDDVNPEPGGDASQPWFGWSSFRSRTGARYAPPRISHESLVRTIRQIRSRRRSATPPIHPARSSLQSERNGVLSSAGEQDRAKLQEQVKELRQKECSPLTNHP